MVEVTDYEPDRPAGNYDTTADSIADAISSPKKKEKKKEEEVRMCGVGCGRPVSKAMGKSDVCEYCC